MGLTVDEMAHIIANNDITIRDKEYLMIGIYEQCMKEFNNSVNYFFLDRNYNRDFFDLDDLRSAYSVAIIRAVKGFDMTKGKLLPRIKTFATQEYINVARKVMAKKRFSGIVECFDSSKIGEGYEEDFIREYSIPLIDIIDKFIRFDKEGEVINIYITYSTQKDRRAALENFYGQYEERERKRVQRVKERLGKFISTYKNN